MSATKREKPSGCGGTTPPIPAFTSSVFMPTNRLTLFRVTRGYRALGLLEGDTVTWFWIGSHADHERIIS